MMKISRLSGQVSNELIQLLLLADPNIDAINEYLPDAFILVAQHEAVKVGAGVLLKRNDHVYEIKNIAVNEAYQGRGIGKKLVKALVALAAEKGAKRVEVGTGNSSISQLAFYQKCGFRFDRIVKGFFDAYPEPIYENGIRCQDMVYLSTDISC